MVEEILGKTGSGRTRFLDCYHPTNKHKRKENYSASSSTNSGHEGSWRKITCIEIIAQDKISLDFNWLKGKSINDFIKLAVQSLES